MKTPFQLNCKLYNDILMPLHMESDWYDHSGVEIFSFKEISRKTMYISVFRCKEKVLLTLFDYHIFPSGDWKKKFSRQLAPA